MLDIVLSNKFQKDLKLTKKRGYNLQLLENVVSKLSRQEMLPENYRDHELIGTLTLLLLQGTRRKLLLDGPVPGTEIILQGSLELNLKRTKPAIISKASILKRKIYLSLSLRTMLLNK